MLAMWVEMGRMLSWSSMTTQFLQDERDRMNLEMVKQREYYCHNDVKNQTSQIKYRPLIEASNNVLMSFCPVPRMNVLEKTNHNKIKVSTLSTK